MAPAETPQAQPRKQNAWSDFDPRYPDVDYHEAQPGIGRHISYIRHLRMYSPDPSTKVAALILNKDGHVVSTGVNKFPRGVGEKMPEVYERPLKYDANTHGERGAIFNAARNGQSTKGCTLCVTGTPCVACTTAIIESGIATVVLDKRGDTPDFLSRWAEKCETGLRMFQAAGVEVIAADVDEDGKLLNTQTLDQYLEGTIRPAADKIRAERAAAEAESKPDASPQALSPKG